MNAVFRASDLSMRFGKAKVLDGVTFEVPQGSVFGLIGPNGAGKTTTIKILMNILRPTTGRAEVPPGRGRIRIVHLPCTMCPR